MSVASSNAPWRTREEDEGYGCEGTGEWQGKNDQSCIDYGNSNLITSSFQRSRLPLLTRARRAFPTMIPNFDLQQPRSQNLPSTFLPQPVLHETFVLFHRNQLTRRLEMNLLNHLLNDVKCNPQWVPAAAGWYIQHGRKQIRKNAQITPQKIQEQRTCS